MQEILTIQNLSKHYSVYGGLRRRQVAAVKALDGVDLTIFKGECLGLVGESGCGKTTLGKSIIRMHRPTTGSIFYQSASEKSSINIASLSHRGLKKKGIRSKLQMVFQDPTTSLNPRMLIKYIIAEPIKARQYIGLKNLRNKTCELLEQVGLSADHLMRYPHEFSGGQRQRIAVARALAANPDFIVFDEPTSALDVSVQAQILNLLQELRKELKLTYLFITHHLLVVKYIATRLAVMYLGRMVELAPTQSLFTNHRHPYTHALLSAIPEPGIASTTTRMILKGDVPSPLAPPPGCRFNTRCPFAEEICRHAQPRLEPVAPGHYVACHRHNQMAKLMAQTDSAA